MIFNNRINYEENIYSHLSHQRAEFGLLLHWNQKYLVFGSHYYVVFFRAMSHKYKLIYFNARGRAEHVRFIFAYAGVEYQDFRVPKEKWPELRKCESNVINNCKCVTNTILQTCLTHGRIKVRNQFTQCT